MGLRQGDEGATECFHAENSNMRTSRPLRMARKELSDDWQRYLLEREESRAL